MDRAKIQAFVVTEYCPHCDKEQSLLWDAGKDGYEIYCPTCGEKIMLCSVCDEFDACDWREDSGCKKRRRDEKMKDADLIRELKRIKVQTGGLICLGCGHEHNCGVHGCAVIREAAQRLEEYHQGKEHIDPKPCELCGTLSDEMKKRNRRDDNDSNQ